MSCNVEMKIITEDNIDQMTNIMYSEAVKLQDLQDKAKEKIEDKPARPFFDFEAEEKGRRRKRCIHI